MRITIQGTTFLNTQEIAEKLQITTQTVRGYVRKGLLKGRKIGKRILIPEENLVMLLKGEEGSLDNNSTS